MGGATIRCGDFEGADKSGSPISAVLSHAFKLAFGRRPRNRISLAIAKLMGRAASGIEGTIEAALVSAGPDENVCLIPSEMAAHLLPFLKAYQSELLARTGVSNSFEQIFEIISHSIKAKYGFVHDDGWHLLCLHDLVSACEKKTITGTPVKVEW
jgi:hypothetical protein